MIRLGFYPPRGWDHRAGEVLLLLMAAVAGPLRLVTLHPVLVR